MLSFGVRCIHRAYAPGRVLYGCLYTGHRLWYDMLGISGQVYLTSWDLGVGLGVFIGGHIAEVSSYGTAYRWAWVVSLMGLFLFAFVVRKHYAQNKLE